jgi:hypothetical protein
MGSRTGWYSLAAVAVLGVAGAAGAHHPPAFERCQTVTVAGRVASVRWTNPHVELAIEAEDGETYAVTWLSVQQLRRADIESDALRVGDAVTITVSRQSGERARNWLLQAIRRPADGWQWSQPPQGC